MTRLEARVALVLMLALVVGGCGSILWSWPAGAPVPNVVGTWQGTWMVVPPLPVRVVTDDFEFTTMDAVHAGGGWAFARGLLSWSPGVGIAQHGTVHREGGQSALGEVEDLVPPRDIGQILLANHDGTRVDLWEIPVLFGEPSAEGLAAWRDADGRARRHAL